MVQLVNVSPVENCSHRPPAPPVTVELPRTVLSVKVSVPNLCQTPPPSEAPVTVLLLTMTFVSVVVALL